MSSRKILSRDSSGLLFEGEERPDDSQIVCVTYDDVLSPNIAEAIQKKVMAEQWWFGNKSDKFVDDVRHWTIPCGDSIEDVSKSGFDYLLPIWDSTNSSIKENLQWKRLYINAHCFGIEPVAHQDDGDYTLLYYPLLEWAPEWLGGTAIWNNQKTEIIKYSNYVGNRIIMFPARSIHQAMPVAKSCLGLRPIVVFKLYDLSKDV